MRTYLGAQAIPTAWDWSAELPILARREELIAALRDHQVVIVAGETGSGKTTQLPKLCLAAGRGRRGLIGHTQPRRIAARAVADRIAEELGVPLGSGVGFKVRFTDQTAPTTFLKLMTDGVLLAELGRDRLLRAYDTLIIDEAHERSLNIDFLLGYLKTLLPQRPDLQVVITSATIDVDRFSAHFSGAPVFVVEGRGYPVTLRYQPVLDSVPDDEAEAEDALAEALPRAVVQAVESCLIHERETGAPGRGDILIFSSSEREIRQLAETLRRHGPPHTEILPLYSRLSVSEQQKVFARGTGRRIVIATNVAETSLTVPNIHYVIDPGFARISRYNYRSKVQRLPIEAVSQASANQRAGRCGRIAPGVCIRLYSEADYLARPAFTDPEIRRTNLAAVILQMQVLGLGDVEAFPFLDAPDSRLVNDGFRLLEELDAVDDQRRLTRIGRQLARMPLDPRLARMVLAAGPLGALHEVLIIVSALSVQDPRERPHDRQQQADERHAQFRDPDSDFLFFVNLWRVLSAQKGTLTERQRRDFARKHFLSWMRLREWRETYRQLAQLCADLKLTVNQEPAPYEAIHRALLTGLLSQIAQKGEEREYQAPRQQKALIFPGSVLARKGPPWIMAAELMELQRVYLRLCARVEPAWIEHLGRHLLKHSYSEPHWSRRQGRVLAYQQTSLYGLILQARRRVNYEPIDRVAARDIFIRDALVAGDIDLKAPFFQHNRDLLASYARLEDKTRRRDLLVDEQQLVAFYDARIPPDVASLKTFEDWRHRAEKQQPQLLFLTEDDVLAREADSRAAFDFPDTLTVLGHDLPLSYVFLPGDDADGVTLTVPVGLLDDLPEARLGWLVPGLIAEKVEALLRGLPKAVRRQLVPLPDTVARLLDRLRWGEGSLTQALLRALSQEGVRLTEADLLAVPIPDHLLLRVSVVGPRQEPLAVGRDIRSLRGAVRRQGLSAEAIAVSDRQQWERVGIRSWDLPDLPEQLELLRGGVPARVYPALVDEPAGIALRLLPRQIEAQRAHALGVASLLAQVLAPALKSLAAQVKKTPALVLSASPWLTAEALVRQLSLALMPAGAGEPLTQIRTAADFERVQRVVSGRWMSDLNAWWPMLIEQFDLARTVQQRLSTLTAPIHQLAVRDLQQQLDALQLGEALVRYPAERWFHYRRYLKGMLLRLDKRERNIVRDELDTADIQRRWQAWQAAYAAAEAQGEDLAALDTYRWLLEEYRVSLFAQPMKTAVPVSPQRLDKAWASITH